MTEEQTRGPGMARPMTDADRHAIKAEIAMARFKGPDNPPTGEVDSDGVQLRKRGYFEIASEVTDEEVLAHWMASGSKAVNLHGHRCPTSPKRRS